MSERKEGDEEMKLVLKFRETIRQSLPRKADSKPHGQAESLTTKLWGLRWGSSQGDSQPRFDRELTKDERRIRQELWCGAVRDTDADADAEERRKLSPSSAGDG